MKIRALLLVGSIVSLLVALCAQGIIVQRDGPAASGTTIAASGAKPRPRTGSRGGKNSGIVATPSVADSIRWFWSDDTLACPVLRNRGHGTGGRLRSDRC